MSEPLLNIHIIVAQVIACILCVILVFIVFMQTIYYLCVHKLISTLFPKDETNLQRFNYAHNKKSSKYDDIHLFFRVTTSISMLFCFTSSVSSLISITHLLITGTLSYHINYVRLTCFISWLFSHYSMSSVFVGRLYVSFKDSIFQYPLRVIRILSISLASLPSLLLVSFLFWLLENNYFSLIFFISFIAVDVLFSIVLTYLFVQKLYQLIKGRIMTKRANKRSKNNPFHLGKTHHKRRKSSVSSTGTQGRKNSAFGIKTIEPQLEENTCVETVPKTHIKVSNVSNASNMTHQSSKDTKEITPYNGPVLNTIEPALNLPNLPSIVDSTDNQHSEPEMHSTHFGDNVSENGCVSMPVMPHSGVLQMVASDSAYEPHKYSSEITPRSSAVNSPMGTPLPNTPMNEDTDTKFDTDIVMTVDINVTRMESNDLETPIPATIDTPKPAPFRPVPINVGMNASVKEPKRLGLDVIAVSGCSDVESNPNTPDILDNISAKQTRDASHVRFNSNGSRNSVGKPTMTRERSGSRAKRVLKRARSISKSISTYAVSPRRSHAFMSAKKKLDEQQLQLINSITRHGLLLFLSTFTSLTCLIYIMFTFEHYEGMDINMDSLNEINIIAYYYLYWNMGIASFLNGLSLYLSFAFAQWFYDKTCNRIHKWFEAFCTILIVKKIKRAKSKHENEKIGA